MASTNPYAALAAPSVADISPYSPGKPLAALEREYGVRDAIKLASNENPLGPSPRVRDALAEGLDGLERYPDGAAFELRARLAAHHGLHASQFTIGNGSNEILVLLAEAFLTERHSAIYDEYSFVVYRLAVQGTGAHARVAPSHPAGHPMAFGHDLEAMRAQVDDTTRLVFIANPNNPTGTWIEAEPLRAFLDDLPSHVITVLDEAYYEYAADEFGTDAMRWLERYPNLVVVRTFSKAYGLAALRIGYAASSPGIADLLNRIRQPFNANSLAQIGALAALEDQDWIRRGVEANAHGLARMQSELRDLGAGARQSRGNFVLADLGDAESARACNEFLLRRGVIVRPVAEYGLPACLRITVGTEPEIDRLVDALRAFRSESK